MRVQVRVRIRLSVGMGFMAPARPTLRSPTHDIRSSSTLRDTRRELVPALTLTRTLTLTLTVSRMVHRSGQHVVRVTYCDQEDWQDTECGQLQSLSMVTRPRCFPAVSDRVPRRVTTRSSELLTWHISSQYTGDCHALLQISGFASTQSGRHRGISNGACGEPAAVFLHLLHY